MMFSENPLHSCQNRVTIAPWLWLFIFFRFRSPKMHLLDISPLFIRFRNRQDHPEQGMDISLHP